MLKEKPFCRVLFNLIENDPFEWLNHSNKIKDFFFLCFADRASQYNLSNRPT